MSERTPGPYIVGADLDGGPTQVVAPGSETVVADCARLNGLSLAESQANAAFIVRACNAHDEMVEALDLAWPAMREFEGECSALGDAFRAIDAARRKAKE